MPTQPTITRKYPCKDVEVLTVTSEIIAVAQANLTAITANRPLWADPYFPNFLKRVNTDFQTYLGVDNAADLRAKTATVLSTMAPAKADLSTFKINIESDYAANKPRLAEIETLLGFTSLWHSVRNDDQEGTIQLLYQFTQNMTPALTTEITGMGTNADLITRISGYADTLRDADVSQEFAKTQRPLVSAAAVTEFNAVYAQIISVCKICRNMFNGNVPLRDSFSFAATKKRLNVQAKKAAIKPIPPIVGAAK
jgi:hypothetical protein